ncbi:hypothetical protein TNCV_4866151 [Trichonephila clavipes]|nr:hypothetical protein TNCV_4866151 [Trichonephila clavipes]
MPPYWQRPDQAPQNSLWQRAKRRLSLPVALSTMQVTVLCYPLCCSSPPGGSTAYQLLHCSMNCQVANMVLKMMATWIYRQHFAVSINSPS